MPGNSPGEAVENFLGPIKHALSCLGDCVVIYRDHPPLNVAQSATLNAGEGMTVGASGKYNPGITLELDLSYVVISCPDDDVRGPYRCRSVGYIMALYHDGAELISFHWHPMQEVSPERMPHFHVGERSLPQEQRLHVPTPRVTVEEVIRFAIESFGAQSTVDEDTWRELLDSNLGVHVTHRSWSEREDAPFQDGILG